MPYMINPSFSCVLVTEDERLELLKTPMVIDGRTGKVLKLGFRDATQAEIDEFLDFSKKDDAYLQATEKKLKLRGAGIVIQQAPEPAASAPTVAPKQKKANASSDQ